METPSKKPFTIWCNADFPRPIADQLNERIRPHHLVWSANAQKSNLASVGPDPNARSADILFGQPHPDDLIHSTTLKWVHLTTAGYTRYDNDAVRNALRSRATIMTNSSTVFADPCAEHLLAFMLCQARSLPPLIVNDAGPHEWPYLGSRETSRLLRGQSGLIVGFGAIGKRLVELLAPFEMNLTAIRRKVRGDEIIPTRATSELDDALGDVDHVINILPAAGETKNTFNASRLSKMKRGGIFYNIGRGDTVDQDALCDALENNHLTAAYLDVTTPEPLPPNHRLWQVKNCWITPHAGGGHAQEMEANVAHFLGNFQRFVNGEMLRDRII